MPARLYMVNGSHPCVTVEEALRRKGVAYKTFELLPPMHAAVMPLLFGGRTVPAIKFEDGTKVQGSRAILRALEERHPQPPLYGADAVERARIEEAELWGDEVLQPIARRLIWPSLQKAPAAMHGYQAGSKLPAMPLPVVKVVAPVAARIERRMNGATDEAARGDLRAMPAHLDRIEAWMDEGVLGGDEPNAADLQIAPTLRLLHTLGDVRPLMEGRRATTLAFKWLSPLPGSTPAGLLHA